MRLKLLIELDYDEAIMHSGDEDPDGKEWFFAMLENDDLLLHSNEIGDTIGTVKVLEVNTCDD